MVRSLSHSLALPTCTTPPCSTSSGSYKILVRTLFLSLYMRPSLLLSLHPQHTALHALTHLHASLYSILVFRHTRYTGPLSLQATLLDLSFTPLTPTPQCPPSSNLLLTPLPTADAIQSWAGLSLPHYRSCIPFTTLYTVLGYHKTTCTPNSWSHIILGPSLALPLSLHAPPYALLLINSFMHASTLSWAWR